MAELWLLKPVKSNVNSRRASQSGKFLQVALLLRLIHYPTAPSHLHCTRLTNLQTL